MVDTIKPPEAGELLIMDSKVPGLGIRVRYTGKSTYVIRWNELGNFKKMTLCDAKVTTLEDARRYAKQKLGEVAGGDDPLAQREARKNNPTVKEMGEDTIEQLRSLGRKETYISDSQRLLDNWIIPSIGSLTVREVTTKDVEKIIRKMKDTPRTGNLVRSLLSRIFKLARRWGHRLDDPTYGVESFEERPRERYYTEEELRAILGVLDRYGKFKRYFYSANAIKLLMFTGARTREALSAKWDMFDLERGIWTKPSTNTKQKKLHIAELSEEALEVLKTLRASEDARLDDARKAGEKAVPCPYLFPSDSREGHLTTIKRFWATVVKEGKLGDANLYDLRKTFATMLLSRGVDIKTVMKLTGHNQATTLLKYYAMVTTGAEKRALSGLFGGLKEPVKEA
jgi:integrase